jgi:predicted MPP superfamily phosphohydrolase
MGTIPRLPLLWKMVLLAVGFWVFVLWTDHARWILLRKKPVSFRVLHRHFLKGPHPWPLPYAYLKYVGLPNQFYDLEVVVFEVTIPGLPPAFSGMSLVQMSDIHFGKFTHRAFLRQAVEEAKKLKPDLFAFTGDFISLKKDIPGLQGIFRGFKAPLGVYALLGNHDHWADGPAVRRVLEKDHIRVLQNEVVYLRRKGKTLALMGVDDKWVGVKNDQPLLEARANAKILLAHQPDHFYLAKKTGALLQISGHCHGGQICFPLIGPLVVPSKEGRKYTGGFHRENGTVVFIHRGIGGFPPLRTLCPPQVVKLILKSS